MTRSVYSPAYRQLVELLADARRSRGMTQSRLAEVLGRPQSFVAKVERGERRLDVVEFLEITEALSIEPGTIIDAVRQSIKQEHQPRRERQPLAAWVQPKAR